MVNKVALFGYGRAGKIHFNNLLNHSNFKLSYVIELLDISDILEKINPNIKYINFNNNKKLQEIINDKEIKAFIIASPTSTHYELVKLGLNNNKHIFVEKPLTDNYEEINECFELSKKNNLILFVGYNRRFDPTLMKIKEQVDNNDVGKINYVLTISRDYPYPTQEYLHISSGIFHDCATHDIDYVNWILKDKPISVYVSAPNNNTNNNNTNNYNLDYVTINLKYSLGTIVCINLSRISSSYDQRCEFYGEKGEILNNSFNPNKIESFPERYCEAFYKELDFFYNCINNGTKVSITKEDCMNNHLISEACQESFDKNSIITIKYGEGFRDYTNAPKAVINNYKTARINQTYDFVIKQREKYSNLNTKMEIWNILEELNSLVDVSDPDLAHPNLFHAFQTAEMIRKDNHPDWLQLIGLLHDIGKIMYKKGNNEEGTGINEQWAMVGDTFIVGCKLSDNLIYSEFNKENLDIEDKRYNTKLGIYTENCGLDNVLCSWGHDEYLYQILSSDKNPNTIPEQGKYIIRYHSLYAYHDKKDYFYFQSQKDKDYFDILKTFNKYDLYSKCDNMKNIDELKKYYTTLIEKYFENSYLYI
jgi:inositol oxygenase